MYHKRFIMKIWIVKTIYVYKSRFKIKMKIVKGASYLSKHHVITVEQLN